MTNSTRPRPKGPSQMEIRKHASQIPHPPTLPKASPQKKLQSDATKSEPRSLHQKRSREPTRDERYPDHHGDDEHPKQTKRSRRALEKDEQQKPPSSSHPDQSSMPQAAHPQEQANAKWDTDRRKKDQIRLKVTPIPHTTNAEGWRRFQDLLTRLPLLCNPLQTAVCQS